MESDKVCPNCGYQVKPEDFYCPSCRHRIDFPVTGSEEMFTPEPISERVQLAKALTESSFIYIASILLSTALFVALSLGLNISSVLQSLLQMASIGLSGTSLIYLAGFLTGPSRKFRKLHVPTLLIYLLGLGNILLVIALGTIFPYSTALNKIVGELGNNANVALLVPQYSTFFALVGIAGFLGLVGTIGFVLALSRSSRILNQPIILYAIIAGLICIFLELVSGIPAFMLLPPVLIINGARNSLSFDTSKN